MFEIILKTILDLVGIGCRSGIVFAISLTMGNEYLNVENCLFWDEERFKND